MFICIVSKFTTNLTSRLLAARTIRTYDVYLLLLCISPVCVLEKTKKNICIRNEQDCTQNEPKTRIPSVWVKCAVGVYSSHRAWFQQLLSTERWTLYWNGVADKISAWLCACASLCESVCELRIDDDILHSTHASAPQPTHILRIQYWY